MANTSDLSSKCWKKVVMLTINSPFRLQKKWITFDFLRSVWENKLHLPILWKPLICRHTQQENLFVFFKPWKHVWVSHQTKARLQFIIHRVYYFTVFLYEFKLLIQIQINCANLVWIWSSFNKKSLATFHHNHSITVSECFSASPPEDPVYCETVGNTVLLQQDPWIFPCWKPEIQAADRRASETEAIIQSWGNILISLGQH